MCVEIKKGTRESIHRVVYYKMNYEKPSVIINRKDYDCVVSIGNKCPTAMTLRDLHLYGESFPFDYIPTKPALILKYLRDQSEFFPRRGHVRNGDGVWFGHFDTTRRFDVVSNDCSRCYGTKNVFCLCTRLRPMCTTK